MNNFWKFLNQDRGDYAEDFDTESYCAEIKRHGRLALLVAALLLVLATIGPAATVYEKPTQRMQQIEAKFGIKLVCILDDQQGDQRWVFVAESAERIFHLVPVVVPKDATDRDVMIAREASENCATFYEEMLKNPPAKPTSFNMPTHPSLCILMPTHPPDGFCDQTLSQ